MSLKDKVIVITGASSGLGKALALRLSEDMPKLVLLSRSADKLQDVSEILKKKEGANVSCFSCNITDYEQVQHAVEYVTEAYGHIDILINNAGILYEASTENYPISTILEMFDVNAIGTICMTQAVLPHMKTRGDGQILNVVSVAGVSAASTDSVYSATKFAVEGFTQSLKLELAGTGIKVMACYPGGMEANLFTTQSLGEENGPFLVEKQSVAELIAFMLKQPEGLIVDSVQIRKFLR
jgi:NADP-dependent 3-hydroxy acid dehydrogenase YdfG